MKAILTIMTLISVTSFASPQTDTLENVAVAIHKGSSGKLIHLISRYNVNYVSVEDGASNWYCPIAKGAMVVANTLCDLNKPWSFTTDKANTTDGGDIMTCIAK